MEEFKQFFATFSNPIMTLCVVFIAKSLSDLNLKMAIVVTRVDSHEGRLKNLEKKEG